MAKKNGENSPKQAFKRLVGFWLANTSAESLVAAGLWEDYLRAYEFYASLSGGGGISATHLNSADKEFLRAAATGIDTFESAALKLGTSSMAVRGQFKKLFELGLVWNDRGTIKITMWGREKIHQM